MDSLAPNIENKRDEKELSIIFKEKPYIKDLWENLKNQFEENISENFRIIEIKEKGFVIKVGGLYAFIFFNLMPWVYPSFDCWKVIAPHIENQIFKGKINKMHYKEGRFLIIVKAETTFEEVPLIIDRHYEGIIILKSQKHIVVEFGNNFKWKYGSIQAKLSRREFESQLEFDSLEISHIIYAQYWGVKDKEFLFGLYQENKEWVNGNIIDIIGLKCLAKVVKTQEFTQFIVQDQYQGMMPFSKKIYGKKRFEMAEAASGLMNDDIIKVEVVNLNITQRTVILKWIPSEETLNTIYSARKPILQKPITIDQKRKKYKSSNTLELQINPRVKEKLSFLNKEVEVEVIKTNNNDKEINKYLICGKYHGKLHIHTENRIVFKSEKLKIEQNFQSGEILLCKVVKIESNIFNINWEISKEELDKIS